MRLLEVPRRSRAVPQAAAGIAHDQPRPLGLLFAQRRRYDAFLAQVGATSSDGQTSGNDGNDPSDHEEFDFIQDD